MVTATYRGRNHWNRDTCRSWTVPEAEVLAFAARIAAHGNAHFIAITRSPDLLGGAQWTWTNEENP